ncbi:MAG: DUF1599 domain-containing protein [Saprospiraceae bacterium]|nr:DUF1599 domain-containing protein [Saprospiraceae bacterium]
MEKTLAQYDKVVTNCRDLFSKKTKDYGTAWRILRPSSLTDQIYIKAARIRSIEQQGTSKVDEGIESEYIGIINYCMMALVQLEMNENAPLDLSAEKAQSLFDQEIRNTRELMMDKNHDYGEAWRDMRVSSLTDLILMKLLRIKQIEDNDRKTLVSEGLDANYMDIANYAIFALIQLEEISQITNHN